MVVVILTRRCTAWDVGYRLEGSHGRVRIKRGRNFALALLETKARAREKKVTGRQAAIFCDSDTHNTAGSQLGQSDRATRRLVLGENHVFIYLSTTRPPCVEVLKMSIV